MGWKSKEAANKYHREYIRKNPDKKKKKQEYQRVWAKTENGRYRLSASKYRYRDKLKEKCIRHYGNGKIKCVLCGFLNIDALCLDHINDNGSEHRKSGKVSSRGNDPGITTYALIVKENFPDGLQTLCANCNMIKEIERKRQMRSLNPFYKNGGDANYVK